MKLGRKTYTVLRHVGGGYDENGIFVGNKREEVKVRASYHGGLFWNSVKFSPSGDINKQAISVRSDQPLYQGSPEEIGDGRLADWFVDELGVKWEVMDCRKYINLRSTKHWEAMCVRLDEDEIPRVDE